MDRLEDLEYFKSYIDGDYYYIHKDELLDLDEHYQKLIMKVKKLVESCNLKTADNISSFFNLLLFKGFFSVDKKYGFDADNRCIIYPLFSLGIMRGQGVCVDEASMLTDLLNVCGFDAAKFACRTSKFVKGQRWNRLYSEILNCDAESGLKKLISKQLRSSVGHVVTLIKDNDYKYAYDVRNQRVLYINDKKISTVLSNCKDIIYANELTTSKLLATNNKEKNLLERIDNEQNFLCPYKYDEYYKFARNYNKVQYTIDQNINIINDFYEDAFLNINNISEGIEKVKKNNRQYNK